MKKKIGLIVIIIIVIGVVASFFITTNTQTSIIIHSSVLTTVKELATPAEWEKWHPAVSAACANDKACTVNTDNAAKKFTIQYAQNNINVLNGGLSFVVTETNSQQTEAYSYNAVPSLHDDSTTVVVVTPVTLFHSLFTSSVDRPKAVVAIDSLKNFIEKPEKFYGFKMELRPVIDTIVVITRKKTTVNNRMAELQTMKKDIEAFIHANGLIKMPITMVHHQALGKDSVEMMMGVPVNRIFPAKGSVSFLQMPKGRMVVLYYKGSFSGRMAAYKAMDRFIADNSLRPIAVIYERYLNNSFPASEDSQIDIELCYPVI